MNSIVLLVGRDSSWRPEGWVELFGGRSVGDGQLTLERAKDWLSIVQDDRILDDFDEVERTRVGELVGMPMAYLVEWNGSTLVERFLRSIPPNIRAAVDNDHGLLVPVHQVAGEPLESWVTAATLP